MPKSIVSYEEGVTMIVYPMTRLSESEPASSTVNGTGDDDIVTFNGVHKIYGEEDGGETVTALQEIGASIKKGEFVSIVGPSGCGKSTLLHITSGIIEPSKGEVFVDGVNVQSEEHDQHTVGLVFQKPVLLEWRTVRKNVLLPIQIMKKNGVLEQDMEYYESKVETLLELVGLDGFEDAYPQELSGGMQQRVSICRSLIYDPPILLMDEPFGALDALTRDQLNEELLDIWNETNKTILFVTHNLEEAVYLSDRIFILSQRPGQLLDVIDVDLPRPRDENIRRDSKYQEIVSETYQYFSDTDLA